MITKQVKRITKKEIVNHTKYYVMYTRTQYRLLGIPLYTQWKEDSRGVALFQ
jgi:hypothetical protein